MLWAYWLHMDNHHCACTITFKASFTELLGWILPSLEYKNSIKACIIIHNEGFILSQELRSESQDLVRYLFCKTWCSEQRLFFT